VFVWVFHRISGVALIVLLVAQLSTGFVHVSTSQSDSVKTAAALHHHTAVLCVLVFLVLFHGLYGLRTIVMDLGLRRERLLFWVCTSLGVALFTAFLIGYFTHLAA
jgi:succinate dehydrogenase/fumarate reductase cytochrome b subunit